MNLSVCSLEKCVALLFLVRAANDFAPKTASAQVDP